MRLAMEEPSCSSAQIIDLISAVKGLHGLSSQELHKLLRDSENFTIHYLKEKKSMTKIDMEKLAGFLPLHLIAVLMSSDRDEALFRYMLSGIRLLHSLCDLAPRHVKLEQILLDDVKVSEQLLDLVFHLLIVLSGYIQETQNFGPLPLMQSALVACSLYLLTGCISSQWPDLVHVLLAHPKVDIFMDAAFGAVHVAIRYLDIKLSAQHPDLCMKPSLSAEQIINYLCQQCEASLQFLQSLCQQKMFLERLLRNKVLCEKGGVLFLARAILKLNVTPPFVESSRVVAAVSRLKAKFLSILLNLCEAESVSYLDEVASSPRSLDLAKSVASEIFELLKIELGKDPKHLAACSHRSYPIGFLQLNAMRLADIFSDDSNFQCYIAIYFTEVLTAILSLPHGDFISSWCSSDPPVREDDSTLEYDSFAAAGWVLDNFASLDQPNETNLEFTLIPNGIPRASYAHQRTSLFVKIIANLHCFNPTICEEQKRNLFLHKFLENLQIDISKSLPGFSFTSDAPKAANVCRNLRSLLSHAESLIPNFLNEEDVQLLRMFFNQLQSLITSAEYEEHRAQEAQSPEGCSSLLLRKEPPNLNDRQGNLKEEMFEDYGFREMDQFCVKSRRLDHDEDLMTQDRGEGKAISGTRASGGLREIDRDVQNVETSCSDTCSTRGKNAVDQMDNGGLLQKCEQIKESGLGGDTEDKDVEIIQCEEKQQRKRKRTLMNDKQTTMIERALLDEPHMQRNAALIQSWANKLSLHGSKVTPAQLKNWLNNRKVRLARARAAKAVRPVLEVENAIPDKQSEPPLRPNDSPESPGEDSHVPRKAGRDPESFLRTLVVVGRADYVECNPGQYVMFVDGRGQEIGRGKVYLVEGEWFGWNLKKEKTCVVDVYELQVEKETILPYPSKAAGISFEEAETKIGVMRVMWAIIRIFTLRP
ncbi:nodulin homeobox-like isoform X2 [Alnus glutinosa]|uniref:nodulin homeobox-like isoform X2 n=1 Tax=Alnus glutinosa TaxID=3517 RepID=UPI002D79370C|nr:nodulin homeobox-like isoform X2 [Alnus glutinosa]